MRGKRGEKVRDDESGENLGGGERRGERDKRQNEVMRGKGRRGGGKNHERQKGGEILFLNYERG